MRKTNFSFLKIPVLLIFMLLMVASCARSPYSFVKVQPKKPYDRVTPAAVGTPGTQTAINRTALASGSDISLKTVPPASSQRPAANAAAASETKRAYTSSQRNQRKYQRQQAREKKQQTRKVVKRELKKSAAFGALPAKKLEKVEKIISKQTSRIAKKKAASPAPIGFNQWMKIGVILLLVGLVVGIAFADLGYIVAVIGIVFLVLGLIQQL